MDKSLILKRIKEEKKLKTDTQLADFLGISKSVLSNWYKRDTIDYDLVLSKCEHMDLNWILNGEKLTNNLSTEVHVIDNNSMGFILDRYEALAAENALLKREVEQLKQSRGSNNDKPAYSLESEPVTTVAASPDPKYTR